MFVWFTQSNKVFILMQSGFFHSRFLKKTSDNPPFWFMRQAGRYLPEYRKVRENFPDFLSFCYHSQAAAEVTLQPITRFDMDAAILFSDILVIPDFLGRRVSFVKNEGPQLDPITHVKDVENLDIQSVLERCEPVMETIKLIRKELPENKALIGFCGGVWTVACYMVEGKGSKAFEATRSLSYQQPELFSKLISTLTEATILYLKSQIKAGVTTVKIFDSWAGLATVEQFEEWVIAPTQKIVSEIKKDHPHIPIIGFAKGAGAMTLRYAEKTGLDAIALDASTPLDWAAHHLSPHHVMQGNLDNILLASDKKETIKQAKKIMSEWKKYPYIFNLGHGILPHTPIDHVQALCDTLRGQ
jgi:uroporphyrinogen decarboxylase